VTTANPARTGALVVFVTLLKPVSNLFLVWGMRHFPAAVPANPRFYLNVMLDPLITTGVAMQIIWLLSRMSLLSIADLSFVLPVTAAGYGITTALGRFVLHERVSASRWAGAILISLGTGLTASTLEKTTSAGARDLAGVAR
jgi:drug/metabolite transporter (DMT)-like permease